MKVEMYLSSIRQSLDTARTDAVKTRVYAKFLQATWYDQLFSFFKKSAPKTSFSKNRTWKRIHDSIASKAEDSLVYWNDSFVPSATTKMALWHRVQAELVPSAESFLSRSRLRWLAAITAVAFLGTISPHFLLAPSILAESEVLLSVTKGETALLSQGLFNPVTQDMLVKPGMILKTLPNSEATISVRDDGVLRFSENTVVHVYDLQEQTDIAPETLPTFIVESGTVWFQGLVPSTVRGITIETPHGDITVHEGSFSVTVDAMHSVVSIWDRGVQITKKGESMVALAGDRIEMNTLATIKKSIPPLEFTNSYAKENLSRDAVHRRYIAHLQYDRLTSVAGTLPTDTLYPVKRLAEKVSILLTFNSEDRVKKQVEQAQTRLSEAAALISEGSDQKIIEESLGEYQLALKQILADSDSSTLSQLLVQKNLIEARASVSASKPGDDTYIIKKTVLLASSDLPTDVLENSDGETALITDTLDVISQEIATGNYTTLQAEWPNIQIWLQDIPTNNSPYSDQQKEAYALLEKIAKTVQSNTNIASVDQATVKQLSEYAPQEPVLIAAATKAKPVVITTAITNEELEVMAQDAYARIYKYSMARGRQNQLREEVKAIALVPDGKRILRKLDELLPDNSSLRTELRIQLRHMQNSK